ncbi:MAG: TonB-dependent receptor, partial [Sphingomonadales bacterium]
LDLTLSGEYVRDNSGTVATENANSFIDPRLVGPNFTPTPALAQSVFGFIPPRDKYKVNLDNEGGTDASVKAVRLNGDLDVEHGTITLLASYRRVHFDNTTDFDGTPFVLLTFNDNHELQRQKSAELRYASHFSDIVEFTAGGYYYDSKLLINERRDVYAGGPVANPTISRTAYVAKEHDKSAAAFVQGRVKVAESLYGVAGGRYSEERKAINLCPFNAVSYLDRRAACPAAILPGRLKSTGFTPKIGVDWQITDRVFTYVSATKGLRSGAFNARATNLPSLGPARDESVWSYEGGVKSELFDKRLRANAAVYYADYKNIQRSIATTIFLNGVPANSTFLQNAASGRIYGAEIDLELVPTRGLNFNGSAGYTNAAYNRIIGVDADRNGTYVPAIDDPLARALKFERVPRWSYNVGASYDFAAASWATVTMRTNYSWRSLQYVDTINSPSVAIKSYGLLDASISLATPDNRYRISLFGNNLAD